MKSTLLTITLALMALSVITAEEYKKEILFYNSPIEPDGFVVWSDRKQYIITKELDSEAVSPLGKGAFKIVFEKSSSYSALDVQMQFKDDQILDGGKTIRISIMAKASQAVEFPVCYVAQYRPWPSIGTPKSGKISVGADWEEHIVEFTVNETTSDPIIVPTLCLGGIPEGTTLWIASVKVKEVN